MAPAMNSDIEQRSRTDPRKLISIGRSRVLRRFDRWPANWIDRIAFDNSLEAIPAPDPVLLPDAPASFLQAIDQLLLRDALELELP